eukprot:5359512-Prymnesium_polylepis.2
MAGVAREQRPPSYGTRAFPNMARAPSLIWQAAWLKSSGLVAIKGGLDGGLGAGLGAMGAGLGALKGIAEATQKAAGLTVRCSPCSPPADLLLISADLPLISR